VVCGDLNDCSALLFLFLVTERDYVSNYFAKWFILQLGHNMTKADELLCMKGSDYEQQRAAFQNKSNPRRECFDISGY
jgi:hypothetical protein